MGSDHRPQPAQGVNFKPFESWIKGDSKVEPQAIDKDVFGDGSVIVLRTPGHTPGHQSLLVKLAQMGPVIITGDAVHFHENYDSDGVPVVQFRSRPDRGVDRAHQEDRGEPEGQGHHPARCARRRHAAGIPGVREVTVGAKRDALPIRGSAFLHLSRRQLPLRDHPHRREGDAIDDVEQHFDAPVE